MASDGNANGKDKGIMSENHMILPSTKFSSKHFPDGFRILVVDGSPMYRRIVKAYCGLCDYKATIVNNAIDAITKLHETQGGFDLVLSEVYMEGIDGFELLDTVNKEFQIPVILMSLDGRIPTMMRGLKLGARFFLKKPFGFQQIQQIWQHCVVHRRTNNSMSKLSSDEVKSNENLEESGNRIWTTELYLELLSAIEAVSVFADPGPENIYECMRNKGVTSVSKENIANLLQLINGGGEDDDQEMEFSDDDADADADEIDQLESDADDGDGGVF